MCFAPPPLYPPAPSVMQAILIALEEADADTQVDMRVIRANPTSGDDGSDDGSGSDHFEGVYISFGAGIRAANSGHALPFLSFDTTFLESGTNEALEGGVRLSRVCTGSSSLTIMMIMIVHWR